MGAGSAASTGHSAPTAAAHAASPATPAGAGAEKSAPSAAVDAVAAVHPASETAAPSLALLLAPTLRVTDSDGDGLPDASGAAGSSSYGDYITITDPNGQAYTAAVAVDGSYHLELGPLSHLLTGTYSAFATDAFDNASASVQTAVADLNAPEVSLLLVRDTQGHGNPTVSGTGEVGSTLTITDPAGGTWSTVTQADGRYELEIPAAVPATGTYSVTATDPAGNTSARASLDVSDLTAPPVPSIEVADTRGNGHVNMTGSAEPGSTLHITDPSGQTWSTVAQANGQYELEIFPPDPADGTYTVIALDDARNASQPGSVTIVGLAENLLSPGGPWLHHPSSFADASDSAYSDRINAFNEPWPPVAPEILG